MILYNTGSRSAGDVKAEELDQHDVMKTASWSVDERISFTLFDTRSWSAGAFILIEPDHHDVIKTGSWSAEVIPEEMPDQHDVIQHRILSSKSLYKNT